MKNIFSALAVVFISINQLAAKGILIPGYYITYSMDTMKVRFDINREKFPEETTLDFESIQSSIIAYDSLNNPKMITPTMAREISFTYLGVRTRMLAAGRPLLFLQIILDGKLKLFNFYMKTKTQSPIGGPPGSSAMYTYEEKQFMQKDSGDLFIPFKRQSPFKRDPFAEDMSKYLSDCPELAKKIERHIYRRDDLKMIIIEYNNTCK